MFSIILNLIYKLRDWLQGAFGSLFNRLRDEETGKIKGVNPNTVTKILIISSLIVFALIAITNSFTEKNRISGGADEFLKEVSPKSGVEGLPIAIKDINNEKNSLEKNFESNLLNDLNEKKPTISDFENKGETLSLGDCINLLDKMKNNEKMSGEEKVAAKKCIEEQNLGLTAEEKKVAEALLSDSLTQKEKEILTETLKGTATEEQKAVALKLAEGDEKAKAAVEMGDKAVEALGKEIEGKELNKEEQSLISKIEKESQNPVYKAAESLAKEVVEILPGSDKKDLSPDIKEYAQPLPLPVKQDEAIKELAKDVAEREEAIKTFDQDLTQKQIKTSPVAEKLAKGTQLSQSETKQLQDFTKRKQDVEVVKKIQDERKEVFAKKAEKFQLSLSQAIATVQKHIPSGTFVEYEELKNCGKAKPLAIKKPVKKKVEEKKEEVVVDVDGRPLKPEEVEFIKLHRKNQYEVAKMNKDAKSNPLDEKLGEQVNIASLAGEGGTTGVGDLASLFVFKNLSVKSFELTPDMKIPAVIDSEILVSDKGKGQQVRLRILSDIHNPQTNEIVIPKGSIAIATTGSFDTDTGIMDLNTAKVVVGGKTISVAMSVGSADGTMGLKGKVTDNTGKYLAGTFITAFSAGALGWFSQQVVAQFQSSTAFGPAITGAGLAGSAEVMTKISEGFAQKLQNSATVFWAPKGIPVILFPQ